MGTGDTHALKGLVPLDDPVFGPGELREVQSPPVHTARTKHCHAQVTGFCERLREAACQACQTVAGGAGWPQAATALCADPDHPSGWTAPPAPALPLLLRAGAPPALFSDCCFAGLWPWLGRESIYHHPGSNAKGQAQGQSPVEQAALGSYTQTRTNTIMVVVAIHGCVTNGPCSAAQRH